ncbi:RTA1 like protein [Beauveria bassiana ARSEF 2860]|uniref:RTA1 like protein n=1 Tax=Beauveria bassiana (strain ARSEF 2860) TaxID=655819 RepID=J4UKV4_BEAB2|nr:RTA1 like protein [Beauveria bassiana ARSEF 2860]EJP64977.1 RTA1 like protein [Beauveria bassiana ARSEF 2860]
MASDCGFACPVAGGFYLYQPSISGNSTFIVIYGLISLATLFLGRRHGTRQYSALLYVSHLLQMLAFVGRVLLHRARDSQPYFFVFLIGTLVAPLLAASTILSALPSILINNVGQPPDTCRSAVFRTGLHGLILLAFSLEVAGAAVLCYGQKMLEAIVVGLSVQTLGLTLMLGICAKASYHGHKGARGQHIPDGNESSRRGLEAAGVALLIHSIYRIVEMALGVSGTLFQSETAFMVVNGALPLVYCMLLLIFHPKTVAWSSSALISPASEKRKERPPPLTRQDSHPAHHGYSPNIALQLSPMSQKSQASNPPEVPSGSPGLPANPRPANKLTPAPTAAPTHNSKPASTQILATQNSAGHHGIGRGASRRARGHNVPEGMVKKDDVW